MTDTDLKLKYGAVLDALKKAQLSLPRNTDIYNLVHNVLLEVAS